MYIEPNTTIRLIRNCPLDTTQEHTLWFDSPEEQTAYFASLDGVNFFKQTYQRHGRGVLRVQAIADNLYDCNYLMFKNEGFKTTVGESKWFYAFIKSVNYVNNNTSEIEYIIDDMQTWLFDYRLGECFVEREHSATDEIGENLVPEGLDCGELIGSNPSIINELRELDMCIASTSYTIDGNVVDTDGEIYSGLYSGQRLTHFPMNAEGVVQLQQFLGTLTEKAKSDGITSLFLVSRHIANLSNEPIQQTTHRVSRTYGIYKTNGELPNNNKLFTSPYCMLYVTNWQGDCAVYPYEYFQKEYDASGNVISDECVFSFFGDYSPMPCVILYPTKYKGILLNYDEKLTLSGYPQLSFNIDTFKAYIAQNAGKITSEGVNMLVDTAAGLGKAMSAGGLSTDKGTGALLDVAAGTAKNISNVIGSYRDLSVKPPHSVGGVTVSLALASEGLLNFQFIHKHIRPEYVDIIDGYFDMYGYATHKVKIPNRNVRPHWTYVKTNGCVAHGSVPADAMRNICLIYDKGITFWKNGDEVGQYHLDNRPI